MSRLAHILREAPDELEADLRQIFGVRLADYYSSREGHPPLRELLVYVRTILRENTRTRRALGDSIASTWDLHAELLAGLYRAFTGKTHPLRPQHDPDEMIAGDPELQEALRIAQEDEEARQAELARQSSTT